MREIPPFLVLSGLAGIFQVVQRTKAAGNRGCVGGGKQLMCCHTGEKKKGVKCLEKQDKILPSDFNEINAFSIFPANDFIST